MIALWAVIAAAEPVLEDGTYRFCTQANAQASEARDFCEMLDDMPADRCPGLRETCQTDEEQPPSLADIAEQMRGCADPGSTPSAPPAPSRIPKGCDPSEGCEPPPDDTPALGAIRWAGAILVGVFILVVLRVLYAFWGLVREPPRPRGTSTAKAIDVTPDEIPDLPSQDLLYEARRALAESRHGDAVTLARHATLRKLGETGRIALHRARPDREYGRSVRGEPTRRDALRAVVGAAAVRPLGRRGAARAR